MPAPSRFADGKKPEIRWREFQSRHATRDEMRWWFHRGATNYAVVTGKISGIAVVDIDDRAALRWLRWNLTPTPWIVKTSKGWHCYYRFPLTGEIGNRACVAGMKVDVRGEGGYVIGPGSSHVSRFRYRQTGDWSISKGAIPIFDAAVLAKVEPKRPTEVKPRRPVGGVAERGRHYLAKIPTPTVGAGSDQATFVAACRLVRGFGIAGDEAVALLKEWAPTFDMWWLRGKVRTAQAYGTEVHGGKV